MTPDIVKAMIANESWDLLWKLLQTQRSLPAEIRSLVVQSEAPKWLKNSALAM